MSGIRTRISVALIGLVVLAFVSQAAQGIAPAADNKAQRAAAAQVQAKGNFKDAYEAFRTLALDPNDDPRGVCDDLQQGLECLRQLGRLPEIDDFREAVIAVHKQNWRLLAAAARSYAQIDHQGFIIAGQFQRGQRRGGGRYVHAAERDRVRSLQLYVDAMALANRDENHAEVAGFYLELASAWMSSRGSNEAWRLQYLTDLKTLSDYEEGWRGHQQTGGAPVDEQGNPVYYQAPKSFAESKSDGQRWRWCLVQAAEFDPRRAVEAKWQLAQFLKEQFDVQTMAEYGWWFARMEADEGKDGRPQTYALHTLGEDESMARLATGIKRFKLPEEFQFIKLFREIAAAADSGYRETAWRTLAEIFQNRRQYPQAADCWRACLKIRNEDAFRQALAQIVDNWGRFEGISTQPAGKGATVDFRYRNARSVEFTAQEVNVARLLDDVKAYLKSNPRELDWNKVNIGNIGYRLVEQKEDKYVGRQVAGWSLALEPRPDHFDRRITIATPLQKAGAYLLTARVAGGNVCKVIIWLDDTAIAKKPMQGKTLYYVADSSSGKPVSKANVEFFGYRQEYRDRGRDRRILTRQFAEYTDADGQIQLPTDDNANQYQWIVTARTAGGRFAYLGFTGMWSGQYYDAQYNARKAYTITDRPVYRPGQKVHYKFWVGRAQYDMEDTSYFAGAQFTVVIQNPKGDKIVEKPFTADAYGGVEGELDLAADAMLGVYNLQVKNVGGGQFRVEEYKKPEYEVNVEAPTEPVVLGEKIQATVKAKYYFGSPVTKAKVKVKVERSGYTERWYPYGPWDWLYGAGYWWFAYDYDWYPGWSIWGCRRPVPVWWVSRSQQPPELVSDRETEIGPDGTLKVDIDTAVAKAIHGDQDHQYNITVEVTDQSRRTIVGSGRVLVARKPFTVTAWLHRGYYRVGDTIQAGFAARTLDGKPVVGKGVAQLLRVSYKEGAPQETPVQKWDLPSGEDGMAKLKMQASEAGQYRLAYKLTDAKGHAQEGAYVFTVIGQGFDGAAFRFQHIELVPDKQDYQPGDKVRLMVNTDRLGGTVLLFVRPANGVYLPPETIRLDGKSTVREIAVSKKDMPNFFVEALTIAAGRVHAEAREIIVPPEKRVLNVDVAASAESYRPGQKASVKIKLTDFHGQPFVGSTVVAVYDKSVEYISGGSNVPEIKEFFWKWRRQHHVQTEDSLGRYFGNMDLPNKPGMGDLGVFGGSVADEEDKGESGVDRRKSMGLMGGMGGGMGQSRAKGAMMDAMAPPSPTAAMPMSAARPELAAETAPGAAPAGDGGQPTMVQPTLRTKFADTALWVAALTTDADGTASVQLDMPENLTTWRIKTWALGHGTKVGEGFVDVVTRKDLIIRMQAPRFFVQKDEVVLSANVHNYLKQAKSVRVLLELDGKQLAPLDELARTAQVPAGEEARVDWRVKVNEEGEAVIRMKALTDEESDAMEMRFPCYVHGMLKTDSYSGALRSDQPLGRFTVTVPAERRAGQTLLEVRWSPTLAGAMVDALPYLVDYPYGCTEQTLSRFLPSVIVQKILIEKGLNLEDIKKKRTNLNAQEIGDDRTRAADWKRIVAANRTERNPVFDNEEVKRMVKAGLERLVDMQLSDGGWGWFSGWGEYASPHTTAYVVHGLQIAKQNDLALVPGVLERGVEWLRRYQDKQVLELTNALKKPKPVHPWKDHVDNLDAFVYMVLADAGVRSDQMRDYLDRDRTKLALYGLAMFGLACEKQQDRQRLDLVMQNLRQYLVEDEENQTAWLNLPESNYWWYWYGSEYEAQAYYLKLLSRTDPKGQTASRLVKYLLNNRKHATYWKSTRDTAVCIEAMAEYLRASGEDRPEMTVEVWLDGKLHKAVEITAANLFDFDNKLVLAGDALSAGAHQVELKKKGRGPLYYNGYLTNFTLEDMIAKAGLEVKVQRKYYRLREVKKTEKAAGSRGQAVDQTTLKYDREELANLALLKSGELVEIELEIDSKNDYEYLVFEDMKPAGFEPVDLRSGYTGNEMGAYVEFRDNRVVFFVRGLARGKHSVSYRMRAEIPGRFSALPTRGWAMYAPELKANSDEIKLRVSD